MQNRLRLGIMSGLLAIGAGFIGWQGWTTHQLQQQVDTLQQQLAAQAPAPSNPPLNNSPLNTPFSSNAPSGNSPFDSDPFADMQRMQQEMHQRMQQMLQGFGMNTPLFDMDPFQGGSGFSSSMGFGVQPDFEFSEAQDEYIVTVKIPQGSNVEINTEVKDDELTIQGKVSVQQNDQNNSGAFSSVQTQQFARTLTLPGDVDVLGITNETVGDEVRIKLPKQKGGSGL
jgi:HSP20 family molecular chaperone IbpA